MSRSKLLLSALGITAATMPLSASEQVTVNKVDTAALLDGRCGNDEWDAATRISVGSDAEILLMHDDNSLFICAKGQDGEPTVLDVYIENAETGQLHELHLSAQMGESIFDGTEWGERVMWELEDYAGFWSPYYGREESDDGLRPIFYRNSHKQLQILRKKFPGTSWNMMINLSIGRNRQWVEHPYPTGAVDIDPKSWATYSFSP